MKGKKQEGVTQNLCMYLCSLLYRQSFLWCITEDLRTCSTEFKVIWMRYVLVFLGLYLWPVPAKAPLENLSNAPSTVGNKQIWRVLFVQWRWQTTSAPRDDTTQREGVKGQRIKRQHLCSHLTGWKKSGRSGWRGVWERVGVALEARMEDTSLPAAAVRSKGTQGLLFPLRSLSPRRSLVFPQQTVGTMKAACSPPLAQRAVNTGPIRPWMAESAFPWKSSQWPASP